jgi:hypothetical protein
MKKILSRRGCGNVAACKRKMKRHRHACEDRTCSNAAADARKDGDVEESFDLPVG